MPCWNSSSNFCLESILVLETGSFDVFLTTHQTLSSYYSSCEVSAVLPGFYRCENRLGEIRECSQGYTAGKERNRGWNPVCVCPSYHPSRKESAKKHMKLLAQEKHILFFFFFPSFNQQLARVLLGNCLHQVDIFISASWKWKIRYEWKTFNF